MPAASAVSAQTPEAGTRRWPLGRAIGGCLLAFSCVVLVFLIIGGVAVRQGLQERAARTREQAAVHYQRGIAHMEANEYELAIAELEHTLRLDPAHRDAREALREAKTVALAQPTPTSATLQEATSAILAEAEALAQDQEWEEVTLRLSQLRDLAPDFQPQMVSDLLYTAYFNLGVQLVSENQLNQGVHAFEQALVERPDDQEASRQLDLASLYVSAETTWGADWPSTIDFLEQLYTLTPNYLDVSAKLYQAYEAYGDDLFAEEAWCLAELQYAEAALLKPGSAIQSKWEDAVELCRTPTPTPRPIVTPRLTVTRTPSVTATTSITQTTLSASGSILFSRFSAKDMLWEIAAATPSGDEPVVILNDATQPATSPNGQLLAYHAELAESEGLHVFNVATGEDIRVTTFREDATPDWAPDNSRFVFPSQRSGDRRWQIYIGWADGKGDPVPLIEGRTPSWSPDGAIIAYQGTDAQGNNPGLYLVSAEGGPSVRLTQDETDRAPDWSPDCAAGGLTLTPEGISATTPRDQAGSDCRIVFMSSRAGDWEIFVTSVLSGTVTRLSTSTGNDGLPTWSPDGYHIAFVSNRDGSWGVYIMPATGGQAVKVADWSEEHADWLVERIDWVK
jgi:tetratricopeptide (TPR) repeat protein